MNGVLPLILHASELFGVTPEEVTSKSKSRAGNTARQAVAYVAHKRGILRKIVAYELGDREYSTIAHAQRQAGKKVMNELSFRRAVEAMLKGKQSNSLQLRLELFQQAA